MFPLESVVEASWKERKSAAEAKEKEASRVIRIKSFLFIDFYMYTIVNGVPAKAMLGAVTKVIVDPATEYSTG